MSRGCHRSAGRPRWRSWLDVHEYSRRPPHIPYIPVKTQLFLTPVVAFLSRGWHSEAIPMLHSWKLLCWGPDSVLVSAAYLFMQCKVTCIPPWLHTLFNGMWKEILTAVIPSIPSCLSVGWWYLRCVNGEWMSLFVSIDLVLTLLHLNSRYLNWCLWLPRKCVIIYTLYH